jgi:hypothetical protein
MATTRGIHDQVRNTLDYLVEAELALYANVVSLEHTRVSWHAPARGGAFLDNYEHPSIDQYVVWLTAGEYSAVLFDGSLLQITYDVEGGVVIGHRLGYFPCPYEMDRSLLEAGEALADVVDMYRDSDAVLRSPIRFDFDPGASGLGHPSSHMTLNSVSCRVACVAPLHVLRFLDFVFSHFYPELRAAHEPFFGSATWQHIGPVSLHDRDRQRVHIMWDVHASATGGVLGR